MNHLYIFSQSRLSWGILNLSCLALLLSALSFQHILELDPCIKCIYQRMAVIGIFIASALPLIYNHKFTRLIAYAVWGYSAIKGLQVAREHIAIIFTDNPFMAVCDIVPNFPSFMPLHDWFPAIFAATGDCLDNTWKFLGWGMANWLQVIFIIYIAILATVLVSHFFRSSQVD